MIGKQGYMSLKWITTGWKVFPLKLGASGEHISIKKNYYEQMILLPSRAPSLPLCVSGRVYWQTFQKPLSLNSWSTGKDICGCGIGWCKLAALKGTAGNVFSHQGWCLWSQFPWAEWTQWNKSLFISQDTVMCSMFYPVPARMAVLCVLPCREHQRNGKTRGKGWLPLAVSTQNVVCTLTLVLPLFVFPFVFCVRGTPPTGWSACSVGKGVF